MKTLIRAAMALTLAAGLLTTGVAFDAPGCPPW